MAEYGRVGQASDYAEPARRPLNKKVSKSTTYDLGDKVILDHLRALVADTQSFDGNASVSINAGDSQRDGSWCKITILDAV